MKVELTAPFQGTLVAEGIGLAPLRIFQLDGGTEAVDYLPQLPLWKDYPRGRALLVRVRGQTVVHETVFDKQTNEVSGGTPTIASLTSLIIVTDPVDKRDNAVKGIIENRMQFLKPKAANVFVIEKRDAFILKVVKNWREALLRKAGLTVPDEIGGVYTREFSDHLVWAARLGLPHDKNTVNLLFTLQKPGEDWGHFQWRMGLPQKAIDRYMGAGFMVEELDLTELLEKLSATTKPQDAIWAANHGFGVRLTIKCGCQAHIDIKGIQTLTPCHDETCDGRRRLRSVGVRKVDDHEYKYDLTTHNQVLPHDPCPACDTPRLLNVTQLRHAHKLATHVQLRFEVSCPHCGKPYVEKKKIPIGDVKGVAYQQSKKEAQTKATRGRRKTT